MPGGEYHADGDEDQGDHGDEGWGGDGDVGYQVDIYGDEDLVGGDGDEGCQVGNIMQIEMKIMEIVEMKDGVGMEMKIIMNVEMEMINF